MYARARGLAILGAVHDKVGHRMPLGIEAKVVHEGIAKELRVARSAGQIASRDDEVGIAIVYLQGNAGGLYDVYFLFHSLRGSVITPVTALAATVRGEARMVRAPGP